MKPCRVAADYIPAGGFSQGGPSPPPYPSGWENLLSDDHIETLLRVVVRETVVAVKCHQHPRLTGPFTESDPRNREEIK
jgi:hypothetical protein